MTLGERIRTARKQTQLSQKELAVLIGVSQQAIAQFETNRIRPSMDTLRKIAVALGNSDLLNLDWDLKMELAVDPAEESFEVFMKEHGAFITSKKNDEGILIEYRISFDGETYEVPVEIWKKTHDHLFAVCKEFVKVMGHKNQNDI